MESDAWRCRRTDGRKWRCGMNVVPNHKYCDRHMHRGRHRLRKPLELQLPPSTPHFQASAIAPPGKTSAEPQTLHPANPLPRHVGPPASLNNKTQNHGGGSKVSTRDGLATVTATHAVKKRPAERSVPTTLTTVAAAADLCVLKRTAKVRRAATSVSANGDTSSNAKSGTHNNNVSSHGLDFSPKSVLPVERCSGSCFQGVAISSEDEPGRCRRTDGKKWRCRRHVVSNQKYCERHLHRGAKRGPEPHSALPSSFRQQPVYYKLPRKADSGSLKATPTIATDCGSLKAAPTVATQNAASAPPPPVTHYNVRTASTSSDATISDDGFIVTSTN